MDHENRTSGELISSLKSSFRDSEFSKVESIIVAREARLKRDIKLMKEENESKMEMFKMEKFELENELKKFKNRCSELEGLNFQLHEKQEITSEREKERSSEDKWKKLLEEERNRSEEDKIELRSRNCALESDKRKAESVAENWKRKHEKLETGIQKVEEDMQLLMDMDPKLEVAGENGERILTNNEAQNIGGPDGDHDREENMDMAQEQSRPMAEGSGRPPRSIIEIIDIDDDCALGGHLLSHQTNMQNEDPAISRPRQDKFWEILNSWDIFGQSLSDSSSSSSSSNSDDDVNQGEKKWDTISDMIDAFEKDNNLYLEAVCALCRQHISLFKSPRSLSSFSGTGFVPQYEFRGRTLAKFLTDEDPQGKLKKSVAELLQHDPAGLDDCKIIARSHSKQLFKMDLKKQDPLFLS